MNSREPCSGCAFTPGAAANREPHNALRGVICVRAGIPFFCHHGQDWQNQTLDHSVTGAQFRAQGWRICGGWVREVRRLVALGHFRRARLWKRGAGTVALEELALMLSAKKPGEKNWHKGRLRRLLEHLA